jgi:hypothetical protein
LIFSSPRDHESNFVLDPEWALGSSAESLKQTNPAFLNDRPSVETNLSESPRPCLLVHHPHQNCALNRMSPTSDICDTIPGSTQAAPSPVRHPRGGVLDGTFTGAVLTTKITPLHQKWPQVLNRHRTLPTQANRARLLISRSPPTALLKGFVPMLKGTFCN